MLRIIRSSDKKSLDRLFRARTARLEEAEPVARRILDDVRREGDRALIRYARKFDGVDLRRQGFTVSREEIREACRQVP
ncbi:MAG TPA: histidinol dehydrogenase, partial [Terriglobia bacterium]|nr:histidinol dehydrogenase [Terriglobia bacterium]